MLQTIEDRADQYGTPTTLTLSDRLITLAREADRAGFVVTAEHLVRLAIDVFDEAPHRAH